MSESRTNIAVPALCAVAATLCFGGVPPVLRHLRLYLDPWTVNAVRYSTAALFWLPFTIIMSRRLGATGTARFGGNIWIAALIPTVWNILGQVGWAVCPYYAEASTIGFVIRSSFIFTVLTGLAFIPDERQLLRRPVFYMGVVLGVSGVA
ncbi:MAG: EamA family transporter, partial [Planctomycetota bacterium]